MSNGAIACCDPAKLPAPPLINGFRLLIAGAWTQINVPIPTQGIPVDCQCGPIYVSYRNRGDNTTYQELKASSIQQPYGYSLAPNVDNWVFYDGFAGGPAPTQIRVSEQPAGAVNMTQFPTPGYQLFESGFLATSNAQRRYTTDTAAGFVAVVATTPTWLFSNSGVPANRNLILRSINLVQDAPVAGGNITIQVVIDNVNRYTAIGADISAQVANVNSDSPSTTSLTQARRRPTASVAGAGTRTIVDTLVSPSLAANTKIKFDDGTEVGRTGSLLIYTSAAVTAPTFRLTMEHVER